MKAVWWSTLFYLIVLLVQDEACAFRSSGSRMLLSSTSARIPNPRQRDTVTTTALQFAAEEPPPVVERPDPSILLSAQDGNVQKLGVVAISAGLVLGTGAVVQLLSLLQDVLPAVSMSHVACVSCSRE